MTVVIRNMEKGWIARYTCPSDKRACLLTLTDAGRQVIEHALPLHIEKIEKPFQSTEEEQEN